MIFAAPARIVTSSRMLNRRMPLGRKSSYALFWLIGTKLVADSRSEPLDRRSLVT